ELIGPVGSGSELERILSLQDIEVGISLLNQMREEFKQQGPKARKFDEIAASSSLEDAIVYFASVLAPVQPVDDSKLPLPLQPAIERVLKHLVTDSSRVRAD